MSARVADCPSCGAPIEYRGAGTLIVVCEHCSTASWRKDVALESIGKVAELAPIESPLALGVRGRLDGRGFALAGLVQLERDEAHQGGVWNEWSALFDDGEAAWVAEAQGEILITREVDGLALADQQLVLPAWSAIRPELEVDLGKLGRFVVTERGVGIVRTIRGELPEPLAPNTQRRYADLSSANGGFATLDYGEKGEGDPQLYVGLRKTLEQLALDVSGAHGDDAGKARRVRASKIDCQKCGGAIELRDADAVERLGCPYCDALLDPTSEKAKVVGTARSIRSTPKILLGTRGRLRGADHEVIAYLVRSVTVEGVRYPWDEYLLRREDGAYRWLTCSRGHWGYVEPLELADVKRTANVATWKGESFAHFSGGKAKVDLVLGEVYWPVKLGETVKVDDFVAPPRMISIERSDAEVTVSLGTYLERDDVAAAFRLAPNTLPAPSGVFANQPNTLRPKIGPLWKACVALALALFVLGIGFTLTRREREVLALQLPLDAPTTAISTKQLATDEFELADRPTRIVVRSTGIPEGRVELDGALVESATQAVHDFDLRASARSDADLPDTSGSSEFEWPGMTPGRYRLRLDVRLVQSATNAARFVDVSIRQGRAHPEWALIALFLLALPPLLVTLASWGLENARWQESDHA